MEFSQPKHKGIIKKEVCANEADEHVRFAAERHNYTTLRQQADRTEIPAGLRSSASLSAKI